MTAGRHIGLHEGWNLHGACVQSSKRVAQARPMLGDDEQIRLGGDIDILENRRGQAVSRFHFEKRRQ